MRPLLLMLLSGCIPPHLVEGVKDRDSDGYYGLGWDGNDCDDLDQDVHPGADEVCDDGLDNDCDGAVDDVGIGARTWYPDLDEDGFGIDDPVTVCVPPDRHIADLDDGLDCDDTDPGAYPGATETWYDGVDQDCDEADDYDQDADGYASDQHGGTDCMDEEPAVSPGAAEVCGNHVDDDCDGTHNGCRWPQSGNLGDVRSGSVFVQDDDDVLMWPSAADTNLDGNTDFVARNGTGRDFFIVSGPIVGITRIDDAAGSHVSVATDGVYGSYLTDLTGDARADLVLFRGDDQGPGDILTFDAPFSPQLDEADAATVTPGPDQITVQQFVWGPNGRVLGDLDVDGLHAFVAWEPRMATPTCFLVEGQPFFASVSANAWLTIEDCDGVQRGPDVDDDGVDDVVVPRGNDLDIVDGRASGVATATDTLLTLSFATQDEPIGWEVGGDIDGDGSRDLIGAIGAGQTVSQARVLFGPFDGSSTSPPSLTVSIAGGGIVAILTAPRTGDFDGDGSADFVIGSIQTAGPSPGSKLYVYYGPRGPGDVTTAEADAVISGGSGTLWAQPQIGDFDADGYDDVLISDLSIVHVLYGQGR